MASGSRKRKKRRGKNVVDIEKERRARELEEALAGKYEEPVEISERTEASIRRRKQQRRRRRIGYLVIVLVLVLVTAVMARSVVALKIEQNDLRAKQQQLEQRKEELQKEKQTANSPEYIEEQAREQLRMIRPGEILYVVPDEEGSSDGSDSSEGSDGGGN